MDYLRGRRSRAQRTRRTSSRTVDDWLSWDNNKVRVYNSESRFTIRRRRMDPLRVDGALQCFAFCLLALQFDLAAPAFRVDGAPGSEVEAYYILRLAIMMKRQPDQFRGSIVPRDATEAQCMLA